MITNRNAAANAFDLAFCDGGIDDFELLNDNDIRMIAANPELRDEGVDADSLAAALIDLRDRTRRETADAPNRIMPPIN